MKTLIILIIIVILFIMLFNNKNENMTNATKHIQNHFTTKSNQAIQQLASMYNNNLLRATKADIPIITSTDISANNINSNKINTDIINVKNQITAQKFCDQNNNCIDNSFLQRVNNTLANENVFFRDEMVVWDNLNEHVQKDIVSIPNDKNITYAMSIKKLNNEKYILGINPDTTFEIQIPPVPENTSYEYSVLWLQIELKDNIRIININDIEYVIPPNITFSTQQYKRNTLINIETYMGTDVDNNIIIPYYQIVSYNNLIKLTNVNNINFVWIPYIIKNLNQNKKIKITLTNLIKNPQNISNISNTSNNILWISSIAFSSNPLNLFMNNININNSMLYAINNFNNDLYVPSTEWHWFAEYYDNNIRIFEPYIFENYGNYSIFDFMKEKEIQKQITGFEYIKIPYINSGKNKILALIINYIYNTYTNIYIQTGNNTYENIPIDYQYQNTSLDKFFNQQFLNIIINKSLLNYDKNFINLKIEHVYYNLQNPEYFNDKNYTTNYGSWAWPYVRYIKYLYEGYANTTIIGTYDYLPV